MITVNGEKRETQGEISLTAFLEQEQYQVSKIAVERNGTIIPKTAYQDTMLQDGDVLEVVSFMGGG